MEIKETKTARGFELLEFTDLYGVECSLQKSSLATDDAIWIGPDSASPKRLASQTDPGGTGWVPFHVPDNVSLTTRMHLSAIQVRQLLPILQRFAATGELCSRSKSEQKAALSEEASYDASLR